MNPFDPQDATPFDCPDPPEAAAATVNEAPAHEHRCLRHEAAKLMRSDTATVEGSRAGWRELALRAIDEHELEAEARAELRDQLDDEADDAAKSELDLTYAREHADAFKAKAHELDVKVRSLEAREVELNEQIAGFLEERDAIIRDFERAWALVAPGSDTRTALERLAELPHQEPLYNEPCPHCLSGRALRSIQEFAKSFKRTTKAPPACADEVEPAIATPATSTSADEPEAPASPT